MNKPESLRAHLLATVPELKHNADRLLIFINDGNVRCTSAKSFSFEYVYTLEVILTDYPGHPDTVMLPLLGWLSVNQLELLQNLEKAGEGLGFEADIIDAGKVDLSIKLPLTERAIVTTDAEGKTTITHPPEPLPIERILDPTLPAPTEWFIPHG